MLIRVGKKSFKVKKIIYFGKNFQRINGSKLI